MAIYNILRQFCIFYVRLVHSRVIWYIYFTVLVCYTIKIWQPCFAKHKRLFQNASNRFLFTTECL
jgi:hypothetical protein